MDDLSLEQNIAAYEAKAALVACLVPPARLHNITVFDNSTTSDQLWDSLCAVDWISCNKPRTTTPWSVGKTKSKNVAASEEHDQQTEHANRIYNTHENTGHGRAAMCVPLRTSGRPPYVNCSLNARN